MEKPIFLFNLDATLIRTEIIPAIAGALKREEALIRLNTLTEAATRGEMPFKQFFLKQIELFKDIPISRINQMVMDMPLNEKLVDFMKRYHDRCYIVTSNLDVWIEGLVKKLGMEKNVFSSKALAENDYMQSVLSIIDKNAVVNQMVLPFAAIGNGNNDAEMIESAQIGIAYGAIREIGFPVLACADYAIYEEDKLIEFLERLV
ncbi:MAG: haloacid dehalogenase-like hydrolase [Ruminococcus sp.]|nr:haloacid dehalogenase-like hydrolase [Ruminococcus sp.]MCM1154680.1 haloacid dehalogenase-like hydrolase [Roseburia sp.]MCM1233931.1 haloacid dehalogenase-like hydrolase [Ruminococcus flavefaciens]